jgi:hypothetical protein
MLDPPLALDLWSLPAHMRLFFIGMALIGLVGALEKLARQRWGVVLGVPIGRFDGWAGHCPEPGEA